MKNRFRLDAKNSIIIMIVASIISIALALGISRMFSENVRDHFIALASALLGGMSTLLGVLLTVSFSLKNEERNSIESSIPFFFVPERYDICDAIQIKMVSENDETNVVPNRKLYFKNSDKVAFRILTIKIEEQSFSSHTAAYIEKKDLFCLNFYHKTAFDHLTINVKSIDNNFYLYHVKLFDGIPVDIERV